ncbi:unnamed protein product, partial [Oppiella nova]
WKAKHKFDGNIYAIKIVELKEFDQNEKSKLSKETNNLSKVDSIYCVKLYGYWFDSNFYYIQMELCSDSLKNILRHKPQAFGRLSGEPLNSYEYFISCEIFREILECVQYLHALKPQIIHRDLKPENILITINPVDGRHLKLGDFGLATIHDKSVNKFTANKLTSGVGTPGYIAPEILGGKVYDQKCDIYSLAVIGENVLFTIKS